MFCKTKPVIILHKLETIHHFMKQDHHASDLHKRKHKRDAVKQSADKDKIFIPVPNFDNLSKRWKDGWSRSTWQHGCDGEDLIATVGITGCNDHLGQLRVQWKLSHHGPQLRQFTIIVQASQVVEQLERSHQCLRSCNNSSSLIKKC